MALDCRVAGGTGPVERDLKGLRQAFGLLLRKSLPARLPVARIPGAWADGFGESGRGVGHGRVPARRLSSASPAVQHGILRCNSRPYGCTMWLRTA